MTKLKILLLSAIALFCQAACMMAQKAPKEIVVVMKKNYTYDDPRWSQPVTLEKDKAITVMSAVPHTIIGPTLQPMSKYPKK